MHTSASGAAAVERLMRPRSVAIVGISRKPGSAGHTALGNLTVNKYAGDIYLVGRSGGEIDGRKVCPTVDDLPEGIDLAVFTLPAAGVKDAIGGLRATQGSCGRGVRLGLCGIRARDAAAQKTLAKIARDGGIAMLGPNCLGYTNIVDGFRSALPARAGAESQRIRATRRSRSFRRAAASWRICVRRSRAATCRHPTPCRPVTRPGSISSTSSSF